MLKRTSAGSRTQKATAKRKLLNLPVKTVRGGDAASIKGGLVANKRSVV